MKNKKKRVLFVCSSGGHLAQMLQLEPLFHKYEYILITEDVPSTRELQRKYNLFLLKINKRKKNNISFIIGFLNYFFIAFKFMLKFRPHVVVSTGTHPSIPFCYMAKLFGKKVVFFLTYARIYTKGRSANIAYPISDLFIVQWKQQLANYPKAKFYGGGLY